MQGNQLLHPQHRVLIAAALFALLAGVVFILVWQWPYLSHLFDMAQGKEEIPGEMSSEQQLQIVRELQQSSLQSAPMTEAQQEAAIKSVSASSNEPDESGFTEEQKLNILNSLDSN